MRTLNQATASVLAEAEVRAATDVTGFGLLGHGLEMARGSGTSFDFDSTALPALDGALDLARAGVETGGAKHNRRFVAPVLQLGDGVPAELVTLAHDPQTSGGLLAAVSEDAAPLIMRRLHEGGIPAATVGQVSEGAGVRLL
jgi:selenide,water dikinase